MSRSIFNENVENRVINPRSGFSQFVDLSNNQIIHGIKRFLNNLITNSDVNFNTTANVGRIVFYPNEPAGSGSQIVAIYTEDEIDGLGWFFDSVGNLYYLGGGLSPVKIMLSGATGDLTILSNFNGFGDIICHNILTSDIISSYSGGDITFNNGIALGSNIINCGNIISTGFLNVNNIISNTTTGLYSTKIALSNEFIDINNSSLDIVATYIGFASPTQTLSTASKYMYIKPSSTGDFEIKINNISNVVLGTDWSQLATGTQMTSSWYSTAGVLMGFINPNPPAGVSPTFRIMGTSTQYIFYNTNNTFGQHDTVTAQANWYITSAGIVTCKGLDAGSGTIQTTGSISGGPINGSTITASSSFISDLITASTGTATKNSIMMNNKFFNDTNGSIDLKAHYVGFPYLTQALDLTSKYMAIIPKSDGNFSMEINNVGSKVFSTNWSTLTLTSDFNLALGSKTISTTGTVSTGTINGGAINGSTITASSSFISDLITASTGTATKNSIMMDNQFINGTNGSIDLKAHFVGFPYLTESLSLTSKYMFIKALSDGNFEMQINNIASKVFSSNWSTLTLTSDFNLALGSKTISTTGAVSSGAITCTSLNAGSGTILTSGSVTCQTMTSGTTKATLFEAVLLNTYRNKIQMSNLFFNPDVASMDLVAQYIGFPHPALTLDIYSKYFFINPLTTGNVGFGINNISGYFLYTDWATRRVISEYTFGFRTAPFSSGYRYQTFLNNVTEIGSVSMLTGSTIAFNTSSDYRLKQDVIPIQNPLERLMKLKPKNYRFIADVEDECCCNCYMDGFIAHEIQEILPMIVTGKKDDPNQMQQIDYSKLTPICVGSIQELNEKVDKQQILIDSQYEMIKMLISRLEILELNNNLEQCNDISSTCCNSKTPIL